MAGSHVAVGYNDSQQTGLAMTAGSDLTGYSYSADGGASFTDGGVLPNTPEFVNFGDPWMASDRAGDMYYSTSRWTSSTSTWTSRSPSRPMAARPGAPRFRCSGRRSASSTPPTRTPRRRPGPGVQARDNLYVA